MHHVHISSNDAVQGVISTPSGWHDSPCESKWQDNMQGYICEIPFGPKWKVRPKKAAFARVPASGGDACNGVDVGCTQMDEGDGDCDYDSDCKKGLVCGADNCGEYSDQDHEWDDTDDCCYTAANTYMYESLFFV